ncbi:MAG TPA: sulfite exporter TauE/SafE family protein [Candidatus Limnocylindrales bacterium]
MSRRRNRARAQTTSTPAAAPAQTAIDAPAIPPMATDADEAHRRALEIREYRMGRGARPAGFEAPQAKVTRSGSISVTLPVIGMTCRSCEVRIARNVGKLPNVEKVSASSVRGEVTVESSAPVSATAIEKAINKAGYDVGRTPWLESNPRVWMTAGAGVLMVAAIAVLAQATGLGDLASGAGDLSSGGLMVALLLGLAAGVSTCMALVGGLVLGLSAAYSAHQPAGTGSLTQMRPALVFVLGRIAGYAVFGAALGAVGASVAMPPQLTAVLMIAVAAVMLILGTRLTGLSPRVAGWSPTLPMGLGSRLGLGSSSDVAAYSDTRAATLGAMSFFLPCGFTQAIQIFALSTGSPIFGAALLGIFAIGTAPGLLALAGLPIVVPSRAKPTLMRLVGVVVIGFAVLNGTAGLRLTGLTMPTLVQTANAAPLAGTLGADGVQRITTQQDADGYSPSNVVVYAGYPIEWTIESSTTATCAASLFAPGVNIRARLEKGPNVFKIPALPEGVLDYTCAMGMYGARITVVAKPTDATAGVTASPNPASSQAATATATDDPISRPFDAGSASSSATAASASPSTSPAATTAPIATTQDLRTWQDEGGYGPLDARITAGIPTTWTVESRSQASCAAYLVVPSLGIERVLEAGDNVIDLPALEPGVLAYTCGMGMYSGWITIADAPSGTAGG